MNDMDLVTKASEHSRYLRRLVAAEEHFAGALVAHLDTPWDASLMQAELDMAKIIDAHSLQVALRKLRQSVMGQIIVRDLAGMGDLHEVMRMCTDLAQVAVHYALRYHANWLAEIHGLPTNADGTPMELTVVGMGKLGGGELNVSSDIDLVYLYADEGERKS